MDTSSTTNNSAPLASTSVNQIAANIDKQISTMVSNYVNEEKEKSRRRLNVIMHNIPESSPDNGNVRKR